MILTLSLDLTEVFELPGTIAEAWTLHVDATTTELEERFMSRDLKREIEVDLTIDLRRELQLCLAGTVRLSKSWMSGDNEQVWRFSDLSPEWGRLSGVERRARLGRISGKLGETYSTRLFPTLQQFVLESLREPRNALLAGALNPSLVAFASSFF